MTYGELWLKICSFLVMGLFQALPMAAKISAAEFPLVKQPHERKLVGQLLLDRLPSASHDRLWVRVQYPVSLADLARQLQVQYSILASLNDVDSTHRFRQGDWLILPSALASRVRQVASLDNSDLRSTPPSLQAPPPPWVGKGAGAAGRHRDADRPAVRGHHAGDPAFKSWP